MNDSHVIDNIIISSIPENGDISYTKLFEKAGEKIPMSRKTFSIHLKKLLDLKYVQKIIGKKRTDARYKRLIGLDFGKYIPRNYSRISSKDHSKLQQAISKIRHTVEKNSTEYHETLERINKRRKAEEKITKEENSHDENFDVDSILSEKSKQHAKDLQRIIEIYQKHDELVRRLFDTYLYLSIVPLSGEFFDKNLRNKWREAQELVRYAITDILRLMGNYNRGDLNQTLTFLLHDTFPLKLENIPSKMMDLGFLADSLIFDLAN